MDRIIATYPCVSFNDELMACDGVLYQKDMTKSVPYDKDYFEKYIGYEDTQIAKQLNEYRTSLTQNFVNCVLDIGIGSGEFIKKSSIKVYGYDINPHGVSWLKERHLYVDPYIVMPDEIEGISLWDTLEHIPEPHLLWDALREGQFVFVSIPIFPNLENIQENKHYRPNEHYYYFTFTGFVTYMKACGFKFIESNNNETKAGREGIWTFVFRK